MSSLGVLFNNVFWWGLVGPALEKAGAKTLGGPDLPHSVSKAAMEDLPTSARLPPTVRWTDRVPGLVLHDLLVYVVEDRADSIVWLIEGNPPPLGLAGLTGFSSGFVGSEVYLRAQAEIRTVETGTVETRRVDVEPDELAAIAFHECMHNVTGRDDASLHSIKIHKGQPTCFTAAEPPQNRSFPCQGDNLLMADHLFSSARRSQWTDGFNRYNDPFRPRP
jgi:hypothetical protein